MTLFSLSYFLFFKYHIATKLISAAYFHRWLEWNRVQQQMEWKQKVISGKTGVLFSSMPSTAHITIISAPVFLYLSVSFFPCPLLSHSPSLHTATTPSLKSLDYTFFTNYQFILLFLSSLNSPFMAFTTTALSARPTSSWSFSIALKLLLLQSVHLATPPRFLFS